MHPVRPSEGSFHDPPDFYHVVVQPAMRSDAVKLIKEVYSPRLGYGVKNETQLGGCLAHEFGNEPIQPDHE